MLGNPVVEFVYADVPDHLKDDFDRWYNDYKLPMVLACPGWYSAARYETVDGRNPRFLALYELSGWDAWDTPDFQSSAGMGEMAQHISMHNCKLYRELYASEPGEIAGYPDFIYFQTYDLFDDDEADSFAEWFESEQAPALLACPGWKSLKRYESLRGGPRFLVLGELESPDAVDTPEYHALRGYEPYHERAFSFLHRVYRRTHPKPHEMERAVSPVSVKDGRAIPLSELLADR